MATDVTNTIDWDNPIFYTVPFTTPSDVKGNLLCIVFESSAEYVPPTSSGHEIDFSKNNLDITVPEIPNIVAASCLSDSSLASDQHWSGFNGSRIGTAGDDGYISFSISNSKSGGGIYWHTEASLQLYKVESYSPSGYTVIYNWNSIDYNISLIFAPTFIRFSNGTYIRTNLAVLENDNTVYSGTHLPASDTVKGTVGLHTYSIRLIFDNESVLQDAGTSNAIAALIGDGTIIDINNPYNGGDSNTDPGDGSFDYTGDEIGIPDLPTVSVTDSGFVSLFAPTSEQLQSLASFMWSDAFSLESFKKLFNNPMDCILGLSIIPVNVPTSGSKEITVGNIVSTISCNVVSSQFIAVDCGTLTISPTKFTGGYLDYSPYTKAYIYLPFIGVQQLNIDDIMNSTLHVVYHVDILTGSLVCFVQATNRTTGGVKQPDAVLYTFMGQCAESVPLSSTDFSNTMGSILSTAGAAAGLVATVATGGAAAPIAAAATGLAASTANTALNMKPNISHSGSMGGSAGMMNIKYPFIIFDCPHTAIPTKQYDYTGFPSNKIVKLSSLSGFATIQAINLSVAGATDTECDEIKSILQGGVIL